MSEMNRVDELRRSAYSIGNPRMSLEYLSFALKVAIINPFITKEELVEIVEEIVTVQDEFISDIPILTSSEKDYREKLLLLEKANQNNG